MKDAYQIIVHLNNKYFIDGRNPNSYGNIAWNFGKHDRAWQERAIFGKLRSHEQNRVSKVQNLINLTFNLMSSKGIFCSIILATS